MAEMSLEEAPRKAREHFEKGLSAAERNNLDYAMDMFESALELAPNLLRARKHLRITAIKKQKAGKVSSLTHAMSSISGLGSVLQIQTQIKKKPAEAVKTAEKLLRKDPLNPQFTSLMVQAARAAEMPEVAVLTLEIAKENQPNNPALLLELGRLYQDVMRMHDARNIYEELYRLRPNDPQSLKLLKDATALDTMQRGQWEDQTGDFRQKLKNKSEAAQLERESKAVQSERDVDMTIAELRIKIQREPANINYKRTLAECLVKTDQLDEALQVLTKAQEQSGGSDQQIDRALSNVRVKQLELQIQACEQAGDAAAAEALRAEKSAFLLQDAEERARRYPNDLQFKYELGTLYFEAGRYNDAVQQFQKSKSNPQRRIRSLYYMALCFKQSKMFDLAVEQLQSAASELNMMDDMKKDITYELGVICELMEAPDKALEFYKQIYAVDISYRDISQRIERFYKKS